MRIFLTFSLGLLLLCQSATACFLSAEIQGKLELLKKNNYVIGQVYESGIGFNASRIMSELAILQSRRKENDKRRILFFKTMENQKVDFSTYSLRNFEMPNKDTLSSAGLSKETLTFLRLVATAGLGELVKITRSEIGPKPEILIDVAHLRNKPDALTPQRVHVDEKYFFRMLVHIGGTSVRIPKDNRRVTLERDLPGTIDTLSPGQFVILSGGKRAKFLRRESIGTEHEGGEESQPRSVLALGVMVPSIK